MKSLRHAAVAVVATAALVGLSACGDKGATASRGSDSSSSSSSASSDSGDSGSSDQPALLGNPPASGSDVTAADLAALFKHAFSQETSAHITLSSSGDTGVSAEGDADYSKPAKISMTMTIPQVGDAEVLLVDNVIYIKTQMLGDKYLKIDLDDPNNPIGPLVTSGLDPSSLADSIEAAITQVTYVGQEEVSGDQLDHYTVVLDSQKLLAGVSSAAPSGLPSEGAGALPKSLTYEMYFDHDGLFRQLSADLGGTTGSFTATFSDWGKQVNITAPPADQVTEFPSTGAVPSPSA